MVENDSTMWNCKIILCCTHHTAQEIYQVDEHEGAHHSCSGSNRPWLLCWSPVKVEGVSTVDLQTLRGDGGDVTPPLGRVPSTRIGKNPAVQYGNWWET